MPKILIIDDHSIVRRGICMILEEEFTSAKVLTEAASGKEALEKARANDYSLVLLDISLPDMNGLDVLKIMKKEKPHIPVLLLTMHPEDQYAVRAIKAGASGYMTKQSAPDELLVAVRKILHGGKYVSSSYSEKLAFDLGTHGNCVDISHKNLSDREFRVFCDLAAGKTIKEIGDTTFLSIKTISTYRTRILKKMNMKNNAEIIRYAMRQGLS